MSTSNIQQATTALSAWVKNHGQSIGFTETQCVKLAAHGAASIEAIEKFKANTSLSLG